MAELKGGTKVLQELRAIKAKLDKAHTVDVGFLPDAKYDDGTPVAYIAAIQEFGGTWSVPERETTVYRKVLQSGEFSKGGKFVKRSQSNFATDHVVPEHSFTIPPRPFFRNMIAEKSPEWGPALAKMIVENGFSAYKALSQAGDAVAGQLRESIIAFSDPPNAPSTVRKKGFNDPLVDTGYMLSRVDKAVR